MRSPLELPGDEGFVLAVHGRALSHRNMAPLLSSAAAWELVTALAAMTRACPAGGEGVQRTRGVVCGGVTELLKAGRLRSVLHGTHPRDTK